MGKYLKFKEIQTGAADIKTVALVTEIEEATANNGDTYVTVTLSDGESEPIKAKMWSTKKSALLFNVEDLIAVVLDKKIYRDAVSYILKRTESAPPDVDISEYRTHPPLPEVTMYNGIIENVKRGVSLTPVKGEGMFDLSDLVAGMYEQNKEKLLYWSAAKSMHHNMYGGLLYHTYSMTRSLLCDYMAYKDFYKIDTEVLLAGAALHDIGKIRELETTSLGTADYTIEGNLLGHLLIGIMMVQEYVSEMKHKYGDNVFDDTKVLHLLHLIASHHNKLEYGAIKVPATVEASLLAYIDDKDAHLFQMDRARDSVEEGEITSPIFGVGRVWHPGKKTETT